MATMTQLQSVRANTVAHLAEPADEHAVSYHLLGRLIQITLTLYLLPAFLIVFVVAGMGIMALKIDRLLTDLSKRRAH
jgi:hypothetical protein